MAFIDFMFGLIAFVGILLALLVGGTFLSLVVRGSRWLFGAPTVFPGQRLTGRTRRLGQRICRNAECRQVNPPHASYCRRCGRLLKA
ncbi:MAG TPA: hypothetical protein VMD30_08190 [Tepidisphaeraceae bacterium]|nr:hypothetical protein [Tepidisphaeraceae bacterium]